MSAKQFLDRLCSDPSFRAQFHSAGARKVAEVMDFAMVQGFVFAEKDLRSELAHFGDHPTINDLRNKLGIPRTARTP